MKTVSSISSAPGSQLLVRWVGPPVQDRLTVDNLAAVLRIWRECIAAADTFDASKEHLVVIGLNTKAHFIGWHLAAMGSATAAACPPRDILRAALLMDAERILIVHNHPSGVLRPSHADIHFTSQVAALCLPVGLELFSHAIVDSEGTHGVEISPEQATAAADPAGLPAAAAAAPACNVLPFISPAFDGIRLTLAIPCALLRQAGGLGSLQSALFNLAESVPTAEEWARLWSARRWPLRRYAKQAARYREWRDLELILSAAAMAKIRAAAPLAGVTVETMMQGIVGRASGTASARGAVNC